MISNLFMSVGEFNRFNVLGDAMSLARTNEQNIAGILSENIKPLIENKTYADEKANMLEGHEALQKSWDIYKEEKTKDPPPFFRENPRIILRALIGRISSFLNIDIKPEDINLVNLSMKLCKDYYDYDIEKIRNFPIDTEYQDLLIKIKAK